LRRGEKIELRLVQPFRKWPTVDADQDEHLNSQVPGKSCRVTGIKYPLSVFLIPILELIFIPLSIYRTCVY
jgi:hypothetical protein